MRKFIKKFLKNILKTMSFNQRNKFSLETILKAKNLCFQFRLKFFVWLYKIIKLFIE